MGIEKTKGQLKGPSERERRDPKGVIRGVRGLRGNRGNERDNENSNKRSEGGIHTYVHSLSPAFWLNKNARIKGGRVRGNRMSVSVVEKCFTIR